MSTFKLRPYQIAAIDGARAAFMGDRSNGIEPARAVIVTMPTGSGKSVIFKSIAQGVAERGRRVLLLVEGIKLVHQAAGHLRAAGLTVGIEMAEHTAVAESDLSKPQRELFDALPDDGEGLFVKGAQVLSANILCDRGLARKLRNAQGSAGGWYVRCRPELPQIVVASVDSMINRLDRYKPDTFRMVVVDECFPAGTLVDGRPIEQIQVGDLVRSYNDATGTIELRPVTHVFKREPTGLVRMHLSDGTAITCTPNHPFAVMVNGVVDYMPAALMVGREVIRGDQAEILRGLRDGLPAAELESAHGPNLLGAVQTSAAAGEGQSNRVALHGVWGPSQDERQGGADVGPSRPRVLLGHMQDGCRPAFEVGDHGGHEPEVRFGSDEGQQPAGQGRGSAGPHAGNAGPGVEAEIEGWDKPSDRAPAAPRGGSRLADRNNGPHGSEGGDAVRVADAVPDRRSERGMEDSDRSGRLLARDSDRQGAGREEDGISRGPRVDRVEVLELGGPEGLAAVCSDGRVYNLEVEHNHNYFVGGVLVHNCHHAIAPSYLSVFRHFGISVPINDPKEIADLKKSPWVGDVLLFGLTATPDRGDKRDLMRLFDVVGYEYDIMTAISDGWLVPIRQEFCHLDGLDLRKVRKSAGDLDARQLCELLEPLMIPICESIIGVSAGRPTLCYSPLCTLAESTTSRLRLLAPERQIHTITGETADDQREAWFQGIDRGEVWALSSVGTLTEGVDLPRAAVAAMLRLTMSRLLYAQILGRVLRPAPEIADALNDCLDAAARRGMIAASSKPTATILDFAGNCGKHKLVRAVDVLADPDDPALNMAEAIMDKGEVDPIAALERAREELAKMLERARGKDIERILVNPFDLLDVPHKKDDWGRAATDKQINSLLESGVLDYRKTFPKLKHDPPAHEAAVQVARDAAIVKLRKMFDMTSASAILAERSRRIDAGKCSPKQLRMLIKAGIPAACARDMAFDRASGALDQLAQMNWASSPAWIERWSNVRREAA